MATVTGVERRDFFYDKGFISATAQPGLLSHLYEEHRIVMWLYKLQYTLSQKWFRHFSCTF